MSSFSALSNPALQGEERLVTFNYWSHEEFPLEPNYISLREKWEIAVDEIPLPENANQLMHYISEYIRTPGELNRYCDRVEAAIDDGTLRGIIQPHLLDKARRTFVNSAKSANVMSFVPLKTRRQDDLSGRWKKRSAPTPLVVSDYIAREKRNTDFLKMNDVWVVPEYKVKNIYLVKPTVANFTPGLFRRWLGTAAQNLRKMIIKPSQKVVGSESARFLYQLTNPEIVHDTLMKSALQNSKVYIYDFAKAQQKPSLPTHWKISDFMPKSEKKEAPRFLSFGTKIMTKDNILEFEKLFHRHKPRYIAASKYLNGTSNPILPVLQKEIDVVYQSTLPKPLVCGGQQFDLKRVLSNKKNIPKKLFDLCVKYFNGDRSVHYGALQSSFGKMSYNKLQSDSDGDIELTGSDSEMGTSQIYETVAEEDAAQERADRFTPDTTVMDDAYLRELRDMLAAQKALAEEGNSEIVSEHPFSKNYAVPALPMPDGVMSLKEASAKMVSEPHDGTNCDLCNRFMLGSVDRFNLTDSEVNHLVGALPKHLTEKLSWNRFWPDAHVRTAITSGKQHIVEQFKDIAPKAPFSSIYDTLMALKSSLDGSNWKEPVKILILLMALHEQTSWKGCLMVLAGYAVNADAAWWDASVKKLMSLTPPTFRFQSDEKEEVPKGFSFWESISFATEWGRELWNCITEMMWTVLAPSIMPSGVWAAFSGNTSEMVSRIKSEIMKISARSAAESIIQSMLYIFSLFKTCIRLKSFKPLFEEVFDPVSWKQEVNAVLVYYSEIQVSNDQPTNMKRWLELKTNGHIPMTWNEPFTPQSLNLHINKLVTDGEKFAAAFRSDLILLSDIRKAVTSLKALQEANSIGYGVMSQRVQPFGIYICGPAGSGKTNLTTAVFRSVGRINGYSIEPTMMYSWQKGVNFQDSLGYSQWCILLDDIDVSPAAPTMGFESHVDAVIRIINNAPLVVEQSRVEAKGKVASKPLLVIMNSNFKQARLQNYALKPTRLAFYRRFPLWVTVEAKDEFGCNGVLDAKLAAMSADGEVYNLDVKMFDPSIDEDFPYRSLPDVKTKSQLLKLIKVMYRDHMDRQLKMLAGAYGLDCCPDCGSDWSETQRCSCNTTQLQMRWELLALPLAAMSLYRWLPPILAKEKQYIEGIKTTISNTVDTAKDTVLLAQQMTQDVQLNIDTFKERLNKFFAIFTMDNFVFALVVINFLTLANQMWRDYKESGSIFGGSRYDENRRMWREGFSYFDSEGKLQQIERNAVAGSVPTAWVRAPQEFRPGMPVEFSTFTKDEAILHIRQSYVIVKTWRGTVHGAVVCNNGVICPLHVFSDLGEFSGIPEVSTQKFTITQKGIEHELLYNAFNVTQISADAVFIKVAALVGFTGVGKKFWVDIDNGVSQFDECILVRDEDLLDCKAISSSFKSTRIVKHHTETKDGDCGYLYLCRLNKHWKIVAMHNGYNNQFTITGPSKYTYGMMITQTSLLGAASRLATTFQMVSIPLKQTGLNYEKQTFSYYPEKSEVWTAVSHYGVQISPIGQANIKVHGSTMKSDIKPTMYADEFADLEEEICGRRDYWQIPNFKGEMRDGKWVSPYTNALVPLKRVTHKMEYLYLCLAEMLNGVQHLQTDGYSEISLEEAMVGIPGSIIQSVDLKTSVGMPFNQPKTTKIVIREKQAFIDPILMEITNEIIHLLGENVIPCPMILCMLKDEAISHTKNEARKARVFNCLPFPYNWKMKAVAAPVQAFIRNNKGFFGSMVGINMTSLEINEIVRILKQTDPELVRILALDIVTEDKAEDGFLIDVISLFFYALKMLLTGEGASLYTLIQGIKSGVYVVKNDLFQVGGQNPSGQHMTIDFNDAITSLCLIYFYYRMKYPDGLPDTLLQLVVNYQRTFFQTNGIVSEALSKYCTYREHCSKCTYGDDSLQGVSETCDFYEPNDIPKYGRELGFTFTDEAKTVDIKYKKITDVAFLKRTFKFREELQSYVGLLAMKTIVKMLRLRKKSTLTERDHAAEQLTNVMRELAYYPREIYEKFDTRLHAIAEKYGLVDNAYYVRKTYDEHLDKMKDGSFSTWSPLSIELKEEWENNTTQNE